jgi:hypothetical protein
LHGASDTPIARVDGETSTSRGEESILELGGGWEPVCYQNPIISLIVGVCKLSTSVINNAV